MFHHPLIRTVAYEAQLKSRPRRTASPPGSRDRTRDPDSLDENAALIAEHFEAAGDLRAAYGWHMRAATWATNRDIRAARVGWERARRIADALPADEPNRTAIRIAPRTLLCGTAWRILGTLPKPTLMNCVSCASPSTTSDRWRSPWPDWRPSLPLAARLREARSWRPN